MTYQMRLTSHRYKKKKSSNSSSINSFINCILSYMVKAVIHSGLVAVFTLDAPREGWKIVAEHKYLNQ